MLGYSIAAFFALVTVAMCSQDDRSRGANVLILHHHHGNVYTILVRDKWSGEWSPPGGYSHMHEPRNYTGERELAEETNHTLVSNHATLNFGPGWDKPFKTYIEIDKGHGAHRHRNITFVTRTNDFHHNSLQWMVQHMMSAPHADGYRETNGMAFVEASQLMLAGMTQGTDTVWVLSSQGFVFDYDRPWEGVKSVSGQYLKLRPLFKKSLSSHLPFFQQMIGQAQWGPIQVMHA